jgi:hypothetical protein
MGTSTPGEVTVTPVYWDPTSSFAPSYEQVVNQYLGDTAAASGTLTDVYSTDLQLGLNYDIHAGTPITDSDPLPANGCTPDPRPAYSDGSTYSACLDDSQLQAELAQVVSSNSLPSDLAHLYLIMLPKGVESCFNAGNGAGKGCSTPWVGGFCGYHSFFTDLGGNPLAPVYADIPFPSYNAPSAPFTCAGMVESLNGNNDADVIVSIISHETNESITDPFGSAWWDARFYENGDECAYIYGVLQGSTPGAQYNQVINGHQYFTQEEASNENYLYARKAACVQQVDLPFATFRARPAAPKAGVLVTFNAAKSQGQNVTFTWNFGDGSLPVTGSSIVTHTYAHTGGVHVYTVTLTMTDDVNLQHTNGSASVLLSVTG